MIRFLILILVVCAANLAFSQVPLGVPLNQLVAYWPLDSNVNDALSSQHHGTATNANATLDRFGYRNSAYRLTGNNSYLTLPTSVMSQVGTSNFTVSIWVSPDTNIAVTNGMEIISDKVPGSWLHKFRIAVGAIAFAYSPDSTYWDAIVGSNVVPKVVGPGLLPDGWWHLVFVYENVQGGRFTAYRNGVMVGQTINTSTSAGNRQINVGRAIWPGAPAIGTNFFKGSVDDIGIWSRALTAAEVSNLYLLCRLPVTMYTPVQNVIPGGTTQFNVSVPSMTATFQWQIDSTNGSFLPLANSNVFSGVNSNVLMVSNVNGQMDGWRFRCLVVDTNCSAISAPAILNVGCSQLASSPLNLVKFPGDSAIFSAGTTLPTHQYQWQLLSASTWTNLADIGQFSGTQSARMVVRNLTYQNHNQQFRCLVSAFGCNDTSTAASLNILCLPRNLNGPNNAVVVEAQTAVFRVDSVAGATYTWQRNVGFGFQNLANTGNVQGVNQPTLRISNVQWADNNSGYRCIVLQDHCSETSGTAILQVVGGVSVQEQQLVSWTMYPNPAKEEVYFERENTEASRLVVRNAVGQVLFDREVTEQQVRLPINGWAEGVYLVQWNGHIRRLLVKH